MRNWPAFFVSNLVCACTMVFVLNSLFLLISCYSYLSSIVSVLCLVIVQHVGDYSLSDIFQIFF